VRHRTREAVDVIHPRERLAFEARILFELGLRAFVGHAFPVLSRK
jgi:hypothetical protein